MANMNQITLAEMSPAERRVDRLKSVAVAVGMGVIAAAAFYTFRDKRREEAEIAAYPRYTVAEITKTGHVISPSSHSYAKFAYQMGGSTYIGDEDGDLPDGQNRFLVKYSTKHPQYYKFYKRVPLLPTHIPPPNGWAAPPFSVPPEDLE